MRPVPWPRRSRSRAAALVALVALVALAGCGRGDERPAADASPATAGAPAPAAAPAGLVVTEQGIGPLHAGMTIAEASAALGSSLIVPAGLDTASCGFVAWHGAPAGVRVMLVSGRVARVDVDSGGVRTAEGAGVGDAEDAVQRLYTGRVTVTPLKYGDGHSLTVTPASADTGAAMVFETGAGKVTRFRAGRRPEVEYTERCG